MGTNATAYHRDNAAMMKPVRATLGDTQQAFGGLRHATVAAGEVDAAAGELITFGIGPALRCERRD